jgi:DNA-binding MarR family transcriptional regulator
MTQSYPKAANLLGALALAVSDRLGEATQQGDDSLDASECAALVTLAHYPGQPIVALGRTLGLTHSGTVRLADRMEAAGLARRTASGQGRAVALRLTDQGREAALRVLARRQAAAEDLVGQLHPSEVAEVERLAARLLAAITTDRRSARRLCRLCDEPLCADGEQGCPVDHAAEG